MRVVVVGGGPGGLYAATLLKRARPESRVTVFERNPAHVAYGFGVVFSASTMRGLEAFDPPTFRALSSEAPRWDEIELHHRGATLRMGGHGFWAITRWKLLEVLQGQALEAGVEVHFEHGVDDLAELGDCDLLVGADGINSVVRAAYASHFEPSEVCDQQTQYIWLGATKRLPSMTFAFEETAYGPFATHSYPIGDDLSTFAVEATDDTLKSAGLAGPVDLRPGESDDQSVAFLAEVFAEHLGGARLVTNNSRWLKFRTLRTARWSHGNVLLVGDAARTAHPNVGSGTKMALEDGVGLYHAFREHDDVATALRAYEAARRPAVERIQRAARAAAAWWDHLPTHMQREPEQFAYHYLTRTPRIGYQEMRIRDSRFVSTVEARWRRTVADRIGRDVQPPSPMAAPLALREVELENRVAAHVPLGDGADALWDVAHVVGYALCGAGLVLVQWPEAVSSRPPGEAEHARLSALVELVHGRTTAKLGLRLVRSAAGLLAAVRQADACGVDLVDLVMGPQAGDFEARQGLVALVQEARRAWAPGKPLSVTLTVADPVEVDFADWLELVGSVRDAGADVVGVAVERWAASPGDLEEQRAYHLLLTDLARTETGVATMLVDGARQAADVDDVVLSGRADICCGRPRLGSQAWPTQADTLS